MGNQMLSVVSTFLYALLTGRVILVHEPPAMEGLFCEPFPGTSWILPPDFPYKDGFWVGSSDSYLHMLENNVVRYDDSGAAALRLLPPGADTAPAPESHVLRGGPPRARQVQLDGAPVRQLVCSGQTATGEVVTVYQPIHV